MKNILFIYLLISNLVFSQNSDYFKKGSEYHYNVLYIDAYGDTITQDKIIMKPLGRRWRWQPRVQTAIQYIYLTDTAGYRNYLKPDSSIYKKYPNDRERIDKYYEKKTKGKIKVKQEETTGAMHEYGFFYMHPPRVNQFIKLGFAAHPRVYFNALNDTVNVFTVTLRLPAVGDFKQEFTVAPINDTIINGSQIKAWSVFAKSKGDYKKYYKMENEDSELAAIFTYEYGFIKMHYTFIDGIRIQFDFEKMIVL